MNPTVLYRISYDGTLNDERRVAAIGGKAEVLAEDLRKGWKEGLTIEGALAIGKAAFQAAEGRESGGMGGSGARPDQRSAGFSTASASE